MTRSIIDFRKYTYRVSWSAEDQEYVGLCAEFPSLSWLDKDQTKAFQGITALVKDVVADMLENGETVPQPLSEREFSGKFMVRIPAMLHRKLAIESAEIGVSLNRLVSAKLAL